MFVKLTKPDNSPIWINAAFVVTVEPRRGGGATVVPIGDGLDYDVRESPESVLAMLDGAPAPTVVPVPVPKSLAPLPPHALPPPGHSAPPPPPPRPEPKGEPVDEKPAEEAAPNAPTITVSVAADAPAEEAPKKKTRGRVSKKKAAEEAAAEAAQPEVPAEAPSPAEPAPAAEEEKAAKPKRARAKRKTPIDLTDEQLLRLRRMVPGTVRKLANTLVTQFHVEDPETTIRALDEHAIISLDRERIIWSALQ